MTERTRKLGMTVVPAMARAPLRRKNLRLVCMVCLVCWCGESSIDFQG